MKIRGTHVTNSSSSSFVCLGLTYDDLKELMNKKKVTPPIFDEEEYKDGLTIGHWKDEFDYWEQDHEMLMGPYEYKVYGADLWELLTKEEQKMLMLRAQAQMEKDCGVKIPLDKIIYWQEAYYN